MTVGGGNAVWWFLGVGASGGPSAALGMTVVVEALGLGMLMGGLAAAFRAGCPRHCVGALVGVPARWG